MNSAKETDFEKEESPADQTESQNDLSFDNFHEATPKKPTEQELLEMENARLLEEERIKREQEEEKQRKIEEEKKRKEDEKRKKIVDGYVKQIPDFDFVSSTQIKNQDQES